ncbi:SdpI/YhfL protein family protein [Saccharopolyspora kobensis]|uniref:SdpI/YhfL protein family protein n=1 Tax=Saccharopolyspora kobensis TaxID=146035 RepID=A0A1H6DIQ8_9PSEU|nr:SdpI/YhfL protein family protein [Saccharopolyspora kobensis]SFD25563.1 SdpI/YhfL protein family protein [Saccharopolyspora kobensis]
MFSYSGGVLAVQVILCAILVLGGAALMLLGFRGLRGQLPRNRYVGVRTPAAMSSDQAFEVANRAAGPAMLAGGAAAVLAGASLPMLASTFSVVMISVFGLVGAFVLMTAGGVLGNRAAEAMPAPAAAGGCSGCAGGCCSALPRG